MNNLKCKKLYTTSNYRFLSLLSIGTIGLFFISQPTPAIFRFISQGPHSSPASPLTETYLGAGANTNDPCGSSKNNKLGSNRKKYPPNKKCLKITKGS